ncbi:MAG: DNA repair protein RecN [Lachnospiraceae bacterium]|nr:DNA repair protein RecN [Lachnospiraceae bacterium]
MLESLHVKNLALIKEDEVTFYPGLNIMSGETGAGKSIILGSIRLALGAKAGREYIRSGEEYALIELIFRSNRQEVVDILHDLDLPIEKDGTIFITRKIMDGRSTAKVNGETVTGKGLKQLASLLISIHGQNDTAELLDSRNYLDILDDYAAGEVSGLKEKVAQLYEKYVKLKKDLEYNQNLDKDRDRELSLAQFELAEIEGAKLGKGEDEELENRYRVMKNAKRIVEHISRAYSAMDDDEGAGSKMDLALREIRAALTYDDDLSQTEESIATACDIITECKRSLSDHMAEMEFSEAEFAEIEERLDVINHLKNKYGDSIEKILECAETRRQRIEMLSDFSVYLISLKTDLANAKIKLTEACNELSGVRKRKADILSDELIRNLKELNLEHATCSVNVDFDPDNMSETGMDTVDFLVSFNVGEPKKSLSLVASGGELSRFMLALKAITADKENTDTLIFDEIDAGISGKTAWNVAEKMNVIGRDHQLIAITHLPQIAAMADTHYLIDKKSDEERTETHIRKLDRDESVSEIARLMSTDVITPSIEASALELKNQASKYKKL